MGNTESNVTSGVKKQADTSSIQIYKFVDLKGGGLLVDMMKRASVSKQYAELDHAIKTKVEPFLYNKGMGRKIPIAQLVLLRNKDRPRHKMLPALKAMENPEDYDIDKDTVTVVKEEDKNDPSKYREVCWDVNERGAVGETILHLCLLNATSLHADLAKRLLRFYPKLINDIYMCDEYYGENVLHIAIVNEDPAMVKFLLDSGVNFHERCCGTFMCPEDQKASRFDSQDHEWVNVCPLTNYEGYVYWGEYPLSFAACLGQEECYRLMLARGANPDNQDTNGNTALHLLVIYEKLQTFDMGYEVGGSLSIRNNLGLTPLTLAAKLARISMFFHILNIERDVYWQIGSITCAAYPLSQIDTIDNETGKISKNSALNLVVFGDKDEHLELMDGMLVDLLIAKWNTYVKFRFYRQFFLFFFYFLISLLAFTLRPGPPSHLQKTTPKPPTNTTATPHSNHTLLPPLNFYLNVSHVNGTDGSFTGLSNGSDLLFQNLESLPELDAVRYLSLEESQRGRPHTRDDPETTTEPVSRADSNGTRARTLPRSAEVLFGENTLESNDSLDARRLSKSAEVLFGNNTLESNNDSMDVRRLPRSVEVLFGDNGDSLDARRLPSSADVLFENSTLESNNDSLDLRRLPRSAEVPLSFINGSLERENDTSVNGTGNMTQKTEEWWDCFGDCYLMKLNTTQAKVRLASESSIVVGSILYLLAALREARFLGLNMFIENLMTAPSRVMFLLSCVAMQGMPFLRLTCRSEVEDVLSVFIMLTTAPYFLFFCRGFKTVGPFVVMIYRMIMGDLIRFVSIYLVFVMGFSQAYYIIFLSFDNPNTPEGVDDSVSNPMPSPMESIMAMFLMSMTNFGDYFGAFERTDHEMVAKALFVLFMAIVAILLVNMLIAMMGNTYQKIAETRNEWQRQWARIVLVVERGVSPQERLKKLMWYSQPMSDGRRALVLRLNQTEEDKEEMKEILELKRIHVKMVKKRQMGLNKLHSNTPSPKLGL